MSKLFSVVYDPPADGLWGAYDTGTGNMSGLIGQAAYGDVDMVMSGVMITQDRSRVADATIAFDSDTMVFVSPPPVEKSKAVAPIMPFNIYVRLSLYITGNCLMILRCGHLSLEQL